MKTDLTGKWAGSSDGEVFRGPMADSAREAFEAWDDDELPCVAVGRMSDFRKFSGYARLLIEEMEERGYYGCHPDLDCELKGVTKENAAELDAEIADVLKRWCGRHGVVFNSYGVDPVIKCDEHGPKEAAK